jgi:hypothetical protein
MNYSKLLLLIIAIIANLLGYWMVEVLLFEHPLLLFNVFVLVILSQPASIWILYHSNVWQKLSLNKPKIAKWVVSAFILIMANFLNFIFLPDAVKDIWIRSFGVTTEGEIVQSYLNTTTRWRGFSRSTLQDYKITYRWIGQDTKNQRAEYTSIVSSPLEWSEYIKTGTQVTVRYLPSYPDKSIVEEDFAKPSSIAKIGLVLSWNLGLTLVFAVLGFWMRIGHRTSAIRESISPL